MRHVVQGDELCALCTWENVSEYVEMQDELRVRFTRGPRFLNKNRRLFPNCSQYQQVAAPKYRPVPNFTFSARTLSTGRTEMFCHYSVQYLPPQTPRPISPDPAAVNSAPHQQPRLAAVNSARASSQSPTAKRAANFSRSALSK